MEPKQRIIVELQRVINTLQQLDIKATITNTSVIFQCLKCLDGIKEEVAQLKIAEENQNDGESE